MPPPTCAEYANCRYSEHVTQSPVGTRKRNARIRTSGKTRRSSSAPKGARTSARAHRPLRRRRALRRRGLLLRLLEGILKDLLRLPQRLDLLRARRLAVLVGRVAVHARVLQVGLVLHRRLQLLLVVVEVR